MKFIKTIFGVVIGVLFFMTGCKHTTDLSSSESMTVQTFDLLNLLTVEGEFQYVDILWGSSIEETQERFSDKFKGITFEETKVAQSDERNYYNSTTLVDVDGKSSKVMLEFNNDKLELIQLNFMFTEDEDGSEWFYSQLKKCTEIYGEPTDTKNGESPESDKLPSFSTEGYRWMTDNTTLQMILVSGEDVKTTATIGLGVLS